jgi:hypothetical protein
MASFTETKNIVRKVRGKELYALYKDGVWHSEYETRDEANKAREVEVIPEIVVEPVAAVEIVDETVTEVEIVDKTVVEIVETVVEIINRESGPRQSPEKIEITNKEPIQTMNLEMNMPQHEVMNPQVVEVMDSIIESVCEASSTNEVLKRSRPNETVLFNPVRFKNPLKIIENMADSGFRIYNVNKGKQPIDGFNHTLKIRLGKAWLLRGD